MLPIHENDGSSYILYFNTLINCSHFLQNHSSDDEYVDMSEYDSADDENYEVHALIYILEIRQLD